MAPPASGRPLQGSHGARHNGRTEAGAAGDRPHTMIYKFKSKAAGDLIMTAPVGDAILRILGKEPAATGIIEPDAMPAAMHALEAAIAAEEQARAQAEAEARAEGRQLPPREAVTLRQRAWPMVEMLKRAHAAKAEIVWGV